MSQRYWLVRSSEESQVSSKKAHLSYRISNSHLLRSNLSANTIGGWMAIDRIENFEAIDSLLSEICAECVRFGYKTIIFSLSDSLSEELVSPLERLCDHLFRRGITTVVPIVYAPCCSKSLFRVSSSISGGSLRAYLEELCHKHGAQRLVLEHPRTRMKFQMPSASNIGEELSESELQKLLSKANTLPFYSSELCLNYFTCHIDNSSACFLLFDDVRTLTTKIRLGDALGIKYHLFRFSELKDFYQDL